MANDKEQTAYEELKNRMRWDMEDEMYEDDNLFFRFLRARDFNVDRAEYMLRQHLEWRKKYDVKNFEKYIFPEVLEKYIVVNYLGQDKEGCIVKYHHFAKADFRGLIESCENEDLVKRQIHYFEKDLQEMRNLSKKLGKTVDKVVYIENAENFSLVKATDRKVISHVISVMFMFMNNYPETLKTINVINAPVYFSLFFSFLKSFLPATVLRKLKIYSDDSWKNDLLQTIDAEVLPAFLGGKRTDPDGNPLCLTIIKDPEPVPKRYYKRNKQSFSSLPDVEKLTIPRAGIQEMCLEVKEPDSYLEWEFQIKSGDIKFGILYQDYQGEKSEVVPLQKLSTEANMENGLYRCKNSGTYIAVFDNRYSHLRSKEIFYKITIKKSLDVPSHHT